MTPGERVAHHVWLFLDGDPAAIRWLETCGCRLASEGEGTTGPTGGDTWVLEGPAGCRVGLTRNCDPINTAALFGFLLYNVYWGEVMPDLIGTVDREWKRRSKAGKAKAPKAPAPEVVGLMGRLFPEEEAAG